MAQGAQQRRSEVGSGPSTPTRALGLAPVVWFWGWHPSQSRWSGRAGPVDGRSVVDVAAAAHTDSAPRLDLLCGGLASSHDPPASHGPHRPGRRALALAWGRCTARPVWPANNQCPQQQQRHLRARRTGIERDRRRKLENGPREFSGDSCGFGWDRGSTRRRPHPWIRLGKRRVGGRGGARQTERSPKSSSAASFGGLCPVRRKAGPRRRRCGSSRLLSRALFWGCWLRRCRSAGAGWFGLDDREAAARARGGEASSKR